MNKRKLPSFETTKIGLLVLEGRLRRFKEDVFSLVRERPAGRPFLKMKKNRKSEEKENVS